jgi:hypothetical protein
MVLFETLAANKQINGRKRLKVVAVFCLSLPVKAKKHRVKQQRRVEQEDTDDYIMLI